VQCTIGLAGMTSDLRMAVIGISVKFRVKKRQLGRQGFKTMRALQWRKGLRDGDLGVLGDFDGDLIEWVAQGIITSVQ